MALYQPLYQPSLYFVKQEIHRSRFFFLSARIRFVSSRSPCFMAKIGLRKNKRDENVRICSKEIFSQRVHILKEVGGI